MNVENNIEPIIEISVKEIPTWMLDLIIAERQD